MALTIVTQMSNAACSHCPPAPCGAREQAILHGVSRAVLLVARPAVTIHNLVQPRYKPGLNGAVERALTAGQASRTPLLFVELS